ncbi:recombinase RecA [Saliphagus sp. LR7]|uniref:RAD55 family ATPase n=1 Tax=Saliphagus sp. LR7 TaxID=2282654 RepID=UPI000DF74FC2|nr:recombinase RecA [Saliphagus sp. LR7]
MYDLSAVLPEVTVAPGTNVLVSGPPLTGKRDVAFDLLADGAASGEGTIVVTTKDDAGKTLAAFSRAVGDDEPEEDGEVDAPVGVVDCVTKQRGTGTVEDDSRIAYAASPVDMTGIGVELSAFFQEFYEERGCSRNRVLLHSISTLLMYSDLQTVFRFLHVFTGRIQSGEGLGIYVIDSTAHDERTMNTLKQLFDGLVEVKSGEGSRPKIRTAGLSA